MKIVKNLILVVISSIMLFSCSNKELEEQVKAEYDAVMKGHDEVMPISLQIPNTIEKLTELENTAAADSNLAEIKTLKSTLKRVNDDMYTWMDDFAAAMNGDITSEERLKAYKNLHEQIVVIDSTTVNSMKSAKKLLMQ